MTDADAACLICSMEQADDDRVVLRDELWAAEVVPGYEVPGWFVLRTRRHAERFGGLDEDEVVSFGPRARDLIAAVEQVTAAPATYLMMFGENFTHFHVLIAARGHDVAPDRRAGDILKLRDEQADAVASLALVPAVRLAYATAREPASSRLSGITR